VIVGLGVRISLSKLLKMMIFRYLD